MRTLLAIIAMTFGFVAGAQQKTIEVKLNLLDGSMITGTSQMGDIELVTGYGKLVLPVASVSTIKVGIGRDKATADKASSYLKILNTSNSDEARKSAYDDVLKLGVKAIAAVSDFLNDPKNYSDNSAYTGEFTVDNLLSELRSAANLDENADIDDVVTIDNQYTMGGSFSFQKLEVKTEYGNLSVPKEKIKTVDISVINAGGTGNDYSFKLMASKHISGNQNGGWLKTGISLKAGQRFTITASGEVTLASLSNQKYKPDGTYAAANGTSYPATSESYEGAATAYPSYGNLVYKIGETGNETLRAGAKLSGTAKSTGILYLSIYETVYNAANTGSYSVKVVTGK
ncbi:MAG: hypothetical protein ACXVPQ_11300 [Bacteroidia bacterium]